MKPKDLVAGDWIELDYAGERNIFYVLHNHNTTDIGYVRCSKKGWLVSGTQSFSYDMLKTKQLMYLGQGKKRWWRVLLPFINDLIPIYSAPK